MIYLDNAATTYTFDEVLREMDDVNQNSYANPSSMHAAGYLAEKKIQAAAASALSSIGAKDGTFLFTSGGTESNNLAFFGTLQSAIKRKPHIITTKIEHPSVLEPVRFLEELGASVTYVGVDEHGFVNPADIANAVQENTMLVSCMYVNNETGAIQPIGDIVKQVKTLKKDVLVHTDCVQAMGAVDIQAEALGVDMLSLSAHKIHGPTGVGGFYCRKNIHLKPVILGGHQQNNLRSGTLNTPGICGFALAMELTKQRAEEKRTHLIKLKNKLMDNLEGSARISVNNAGDGYAPHIISLRVKDVRAEVLLHALESHGICISAGSACSSSRPAPSHVLTAMGNDRKHIEETVRISTGRQNTEQEIDEFSKILIKEAETLAKFTRI